MFLDMQNSTPTADKIGHLNFSRYIQDCFYDLSDIVLDYGGDVYQFVGDEAVITWKVSKGFNYDQCVDLYFAYVQILNNKRQYYTDKYTVDPIFRCSIHGGLVSAALVGDYKKEIAYHGDVLNLCSRLQSACKENNAFVLVSEYFVNRIKKTDKYTFLAVFLDGMKGIEYVQYAFSMFQNPHKGIIVT
jgi:adenylate cyclase